jgi:hypothetical protein
VSIRFGATIAPLVPYPLLRDDFRFAESLGSTTPGDRPVLDRAGPRRRLLEAWTTLAALSADTDRIRIGTMVANAAVRNPGCWPSRS